MLGSSGSGSDVEISGFGCSGSCGVGALSRFNFADNCWVISCVLEISSSELLHGNF